MNKTVRRLGVILGLVFIFGAFMTYRFLSSQKTPPKEKSTQEEIKVAETQAIQNTTVSSTLEVQGDLIAFDKIDIFSEVSGTLTETAKPFKVGSYFPKGSILIRVDDSEAKLNLLSQKSSFLNAMTQVMPDLKIDYPESFKQWKAYLDAFDVEAPIQELPKALNDQEKFFVASRNLYTQYYSIKSQEERLSKYTIQAPFSGIVTESSINSGALVRSGQKLGELMNRANYELEATVPLSTLENIKVGNQVKIYSEDIAGDWTGRVKRINDQVDANTQTVKVFIDVRGKNLREGMYMKAKINAKDIQDAIELPRELLVNQTFVYVVEKNVLRLKEVDVVKLTPNAAIIKGLPNGTNILNKSIPGAFDGMQVDSKSRPAATTSKEANTTREAAGSI